MAQSALTVTPPNPTPPTNFATSGATGPNPPNYTRQNYANMGNMTAVAADGSGGRPQSPYGVNPNPPPYYDDGAALTATSFAAPVAALAGGTSAADNNTGTTAGTNAAGAGGTGFNSVVGSYPVAGGLVPAATSGAAEGAGTETLNTASYSSAIYAPIALTTVGAGPNLVKATTDAGAPVSPNSTHASTLSPATNPALTTAGPTVASGGGTAPLTATGTNFTRQSVIWSNGIAYPTTFVSSTSLTCTAAKKATAGTLPVYVVTGGVHQTATQNWTFT